MEIWNIVSSLATPVALLALFYQIYYDRKQQLPKYEVHIRAIQIRDQYGNIAKLTLTNVGNRPIVVYDIMHQYITRHGVIFKTNSIDHISEIFIQNQVKKDWALPFIIEVGQVMTISFKIPNKRIRKISYAVKDTFENIYTSNELVLYI